MNLQYKQPVTAEAAFILIVAREQLPNKANFVSRTSKNSTQSIWDDGLRRAKIYLWEGYENPPQEVNGLCERKCFLKGCI